MQDCRMNSKFADLNFFLSILTGENFVNFDRSLSDILGKNFWKISQNSQATTYDAVLFLEKLPEAYSETCQYQKWSFFPKEFTAKNH